MSSEDEVEDFLAHFGVLGMHWGTHKSTSNVKTAKKPRSKFDKAFGTNRGNRKLTNGQKENRALAQGGAILLSAAAARVGIEVGLNYVIKHPHVIQQTMNTVKGTKAIGIGYDVVKLTLKNGTWK